MALEIKKLLTALYDMTFDRYKKPSTGIPATDLASGVIPAVNNGRLTIKKTTTDAAPVEFTANQAGNVEINLGLESYVLSEANKGLQSNDDKNLAAFQRGDNLSSPITTLTNIPMTTVHRIYANLNANQSLSCSGIPPQNQDVLVIARNTGASAISVSIPTTGSYISKDASVSIPANGFWEFSIIYDTVVSRYRIVNLGLS